MHTFVADVAGIADVTLVIRAGGRETRLAMTDHGPYPSQTGAAVTARYYTAALPAGGGDLRYFIEAKDGRGNRARSTLERIYMA
ncbi:MAG: hypothetical protein U1E35_03145 [Rhodospirillales bacterium]